MKFDKITIAYFWSSSCYYCSLSMPDFRKIIDDYRLRGVDIISIHRPMNEFDLDDVKIFEVAKELGITEKLILDNDHTIGDEFGVEVWPTYCLFDNSGKLRRKATGQFGIRMIEQALIRLFDEENQSGAQKATETITESFPMAF